jgi:Zn-dependent protease
MDADFLQNVVGKMIILILSIAVHEFGHAWIADRLGDRLPRQQGRVTLNPLAHADPFGTLMLPFFALAMSGGHSLGFGWGKPVETLPSTYTRKVRMRVGHLFVALAGPSMNFFFGTFLAVVAIVLHKTGQVSTQAFITPSSLPNMLLWAVQMNYILLFFNLIPARPLDGGAVLEGLLPERAYRSDAYAQYKKVSLFIAAAFMFIPTLQTLFVWPARQVYSVVLSALGLGFV